MRDRYHEGEKAVQERAGARGMAERIGRGIHDSIPAAAREFLHAQRFAVVGALDERGRVWASPLVGGPGFLEVIDERRLRIRASFMKEDPLAASVVEGADVGLVAIEFETRQRMRLNGRVARRGEDSLEVVTEQVYANCPKYIQKRAPEALRAQAPSPASVRIFDRIGTAEAAALTSADTFFIASIHGSGGADCSHRGGMPGFVRVESETRIVWPDYAGNGMFQTLGNISADGRAGLLIPDFATGDALVLTGRAEILWDPEAFDDAPGAQRLVAFTLEAGLVLPAALPLEWKFLEFSPFNPRS